MTAFLRAVRRYHGADFFVDESLCTGKVSGEFLGVLDTAAIVRRLTA